MSELPKLHASYSPIFSVNGEQFYKWDDIAALPLSRKFTAGAMLDLRQLRISDDQLDRTLSFLELLLDPSDGTVKAGDALVLVHELRKRLQMLPLPKLIIRLAVELFFKPEDDFSEDLDPGEAQRRYELFTKVKKKVILLPSILDIIGLHALSETDSKSPEFLREMEMNQILADQQDRYYFKSGDLQESS